MVNPPSGIKGGSIPDAIDMTSGSDLAETIIEILNYVFQFVEPFDVFVTIVDAQARYLIFATLIDEFVLPFRVISCIAGFNVQSQPAYVSPCHDAEWTLLKLIKL